MRRNSRAAGLQGRWCCCHAVTGQAVLGVFGHQQAGCKVVGLQLMAALVASGLLPQPCHIAPPAVSLTACPAHAGAGPELVAHAPCRLHGRFEVDPGYAPAIGKHSAVVGGVALTGAVQQRSSQTAARAGHAAPCIQRHTLEQRPANWWMDGGRHQGHAQLPHLRHTSPPLPAAPGGELTNTRCGGWCRGRALGMGWCTCWRLSWCCQWSHSHPQQGHEQ